MSERAISASAVIGWLRGGDVLLDPIGLASRDPELLARCSAYLLARKAYHRRRLCRALVCLMTYAPPAYRRIAWALIQHVPLSHLLYLPKTVEKPSRENTRRLRHALAVKIAKSSEEDIIRAFFMEPGAFRRLFAFFFLPREKINGREIKNPSYRLAAKLAELSTEEALRELGLTPLRLVAEYGIPLHMVLGLVRRAEEAEELAEFAKPDDFMRHARWFRSILGDEAFESIALAKVRRLRDPLSFLFVLDHLRATGALTPKLEEELEARAGRVLKRLMEEHKLERIALLVDVSGSMKAALEITSKLYEAFSRMGGTITDIVAFREHAFVVSLERLRELKPDGTTSIGAGIMLLAQKLAERRPEERPQAVVLVSDLAENTEPWLRDALPLLGKVGRPPLIVLHVGQREELRIEYPHAIIPTDAFHTRLLADIMAEFAKLAAKAVVEEREITEVVKARRPLEEELGAVELPERPLESLRPGYLAELLCGGEA